MTEGLASLSEKVPEDVLEGRVDFGIEREWAGSELHNGGVDLGSRDKHG